MPVDSLLLQEAIDQSNVKEIARLLLPVEESEIEELKWQLYACPVVDLVADELINQKIDVSTLPVGRLFMMLACVHGFKDLVKNLYKKGVSIQTTPEFSPLIYACEQGQREIIEFLLDKSVDVNAETKILGEEGTALHVAAMGKMREELKIVELLLQNGANINTLTKNKNWSALHYAVHFQALENVKTLAGYGADLSIEAKKHWTPLHESIKGGKKTKKITEFLIQHGASMNIRDSNGQTPLHWALFKKNTQLVELMIAHGADLTIELGKKKKIAGKTFEAGSTIRDIAAGLKLTIEYSQKNLQIQDPTDGFVKNTAAHGLSDQAKLNIKSLLEGFMTLPENATRKGALEIKRLHTYRTHNHAWSGNQIRKRIYANFKHWISDELWSIYEILSVFDGAWSVAGRPELHANFKLLSLEFMFGGPNAISTPKWDNNAHKHMRFSDDLMPELKEYLPWVFEEYGTTLIKLDGKKEKVFFFDSYLDKTIQPMRLNVVEYFEMLCACKGLYGWQKYFLANPYEMDTEFKSKLITIQADLELIESKLARQ